MAHTSSICETLESLGSFLQRSANAGPSMSSLSTSAASLLETVFVGTFTSASLVSQSLPAISSSNESLWSQSEIVNRLIERLLKSPGSQRDLLTLGYSRLTGRHTGGMSDLHGIENHFPNTLVSYIKNPEWEALLCLVGEPMMTYLLSQTTLFGKLPNGCFFQINGIPLTDTGRFQEIRAKLADKKSKDSPLVVEMRFSKEPERQRARLATPKMTSQKKGSKKKRKIPSSVKRPSEILLQRSKVFYAKPQRNKSSKIRWGLPKEHILNRILVNSVSSSVTAALHEKDLTKIVFPKQFKALGQKKDQRSSYFDADRDSTIPDDLLVKLRKRADPYRLKTVGPLLNTLLKRHAQCHYAAMLDYFCPIRAGPSVVAPETLVNASSSDYSAPLYQVIKYVFAIIQKLCPLALFGSVDNQKAFLNCVKRFLLQRRYETLSVHYLMQDIKLSDVPWLESKSLPSTTKSHVCPTDAEKRKELFGELLYWLYDGLIIPLIRAHFYVTETGPGRNRIYYFRHDVWLRFSTPNLTQLSKSLFERIPEDTLQEALGSKSLGYSYIRLLPKETGFRPISNLKRKQPKVDPTELMHYPKKKAKGFGPSINSILQNSYQILSFERSQRPELLGSSVFGLTDIFRKLKDYKHRLRTKYASNESFPKLYFCKVDVVSCFDTIDQEILVKIVDSALREDEYIVQRYSSLFESTGKLKRCFVRQANTAEDAFNDFPDFSVSLAEKVKNTLFVDHVVYNFEERQAILKLIRDHVSNNIVKIGDKFYRQKIGIPQGSVLSTILCNFYYGKLESLKLDSKNSKDKALLRFVDDFLYISTEKRDVIEFQKIMSQGFPEFGSFISRDKSLVNFVDSELEGVKCLDTNAEGFPWCGLLIDTQTLNVKSDYTKFIQGISDTLTVDVSSHPRATFRQKMLNSFRSKCHPIFYDSSFNAASTILLNVYQSLKLLSIKFVLYARELARALGASQSPSELFLHGVIMECLTFAFMLIQSRCRGNSEIWCDMTEAQVRWLGVKAFSETMSKKAIRYPWLLARLNEDLQRLSPTKNESLESAADVSQSQVFMSVF